MARELGRPKKRRAGAGRSAAAMEVGSCAIEMGTRHAGELWPALELQRSSVGREAAQGAGPRASKGGRRPGLEDAAARDACAGNSTTAAMGRREGSSD
ncbi:hypothetical protein Zm00014a_018785 [Zea mays]|uniref:Uncharacterized protein n=1 Tax=Zea mays TaxID=4577 RepID=A0A3L6EEM7_MAIZE|nr:hypothetical protein Zm00014a_018785 [Zea mays]